jgi:hypothetical protein
VVAPVADKVEAVSVVARAAVAASTKETTGAAGGINISLASVNNKEQHIQCCFSCFNKSLPL